MPRIVTAGDLRARLGRELDALRESKEALYVSKRGRLAAVLLDPDSYAELLDRIEYLDDSLARDLATLAPRLRKDEKFARRVKVWSPEGTHEPDPCCNCGLAYSCTWRYAGGLVADLRDRGEDYMDFYCSGGEGRVANDVREAIENLGWEPVPGLNAN